MLFKKKKILDYQEFLGKPLYVFDILKGKLKAFVVKLSKLGTLLGKLPVMTGDC